MSSNKKQYEELISKLSHLRIGLSVDENSVKSEELNEIIRSAELEVNRINECLNELKIVRNKYEQQLNQLSPILSQINPLLTKFEQLSQLNKLIDNLLTIKGIHQNLDQIINNYRNDKEFDSKVMVCCNLFKSLIDEYNILDKNILIKNYLFDIINHWQNILSQKFENKFIQTFGPIEWPQMTSINSINNRNTSNVDAMNAFILYFNALLNIDIERKMFSYERESVENNSELSESLCLCLPLKVMLTPLKKRFQYHFMETKSKLNRPEKPEWYLSQIHVWIKENERFLFENVDPLLRAAHFSSDFIPSKFQLICGLLQCVSVKLKNDLPSLVFDDKLFTHTVDEVLIFNRELLDIEPNIFDLFPNCNLMKLFSNEPFFTRILNLERKKSAEFVEFILDSKTAWSAVCGDESSDDLKVCECVDNFVVMLQSLTDRCSFLSQQSLRYEFVKLQLEILDDFRLRLTQLCNGCDQSWPYSQTYYAILNTVNYLIIVLEEWKNLPFFIELSEVYSPNETLFDGIIGLLEHMLNEFLFQIKNSFINQMRDKMHSYETNKWFCVKDMENGISCSASQLLYFISSNLILLQNALTNSLFERILNQIAEEINRTILEDVILKNSFNETGAKQLDYDISIGFMSLFRLYMRKPELHFVEINEATKLLNLQRGASLLLQDILINNDRNKDSKTALKEMGIFVLTPQLALNIIRKRIYVK